MADATPRARPRVTVVMPALNAAKTLADTVRGIPRAAVDDIILVDDGSTDDTVRVARELPLRLITHPHNGGYGANQKTCYLEALRTGADIVVLLHPDGQYEPSLIPALVQPIVDGEADVVLGSRLLEPRAALAGGMPRYKYLANRGLTAAENRILHLSLSELHTGYRAFLRAVLTRVPFLRNSSDFVFDSQVLMQAHHFGFRIAEVPASTRYFEDASSISLRASIVYGLKTLATAGELVLHRRGIWHSHRFEP